MLSEHMCLSNLNLGETAMVTLCNLGTLGTLAVISRDRYLAVTKPWCYRNHATTSRAIKMSCIPWLISVVKTLLLVLFFGTGLTKSFLYIASHWSVIVFVSLSWFFYHLAM